MPAIPAVGGQTPAMTGGNTVIQAGDVSSKRRGRAAEPVVADKNRLVALVAGQEAIWQRLVGDGGAGAVRDQRHAPVSRRCGLPPAGANMPTMVAVLVVKAGAVRQFDFLPLEGRFHRVEQGVAFGGGAPQASAGRRCRSSSSRESVVMCTGCQQACTARSSGRSRYRGRVRHQSITSWWSGEPSPPAPGTRGAGAGFWQYGAEDALLDATDAAWPRPRR